MQRSFSFTGMFNKAVAKTPGSLTRERECPELKIACKNKQTSHFDDFQKA